MSNAMMPARYSPVCRCIPGLLFVCLTLIPTTDCLTPDLESREVCFHFSIPLKRGKESIRALTTDVTTSDVTTTHVTTTDVRWADAKTTDVTRTKVRMTGVKTTDITKANVTKADVTTTVVTSTDLKTTDVMTTDVTTTLSRRKTTDAVDHRVARLTTKPYESSTTRPTPPSLHRTRRPAPTMPGPRHAALVKRSATSQTSSPKVLYNVTTTVATPNVALRDEMLDWVTLLFERTVGYTNISELIDDWSGGDSLASRAEFSYLVSYDVSSLSRWAALGERGELAQQFGRLRQYIADSDVIFGGDWIVDRTRALAGMDADLQRASYRLRTLCAVIGTVCQNASFACDLLNTGTVTCTRKCTLFGRRNQCLGPGLFARGRCILDINNLPFCSCGSSLLMTNFFDGKRCINKSLVVGVAAGAVGALVLTLLVVIACQAAKIRKKRTAMMNLRASDRLHSSFDPPPLHYEGSLPRNGLTLKPLYSSSKIRELYGADISSDRQCHSIVDDDTAGPISLAVSRASRPRNTHGSACAVDTRRDIASSSRRIFKVHRPNRFGGVQEFRAEFGKCQLEHQLRH